MERERVKWKMGVKSEECGGVREGEKGRGVGKGKWREISHIGVLLT